MPGEATNVIPDSCELQGTVRTFTLEVLDMIEQRMREVAEHTCAAFGASCEFEFERNYPPTINSRQRPSLRARSWRASWARPSAGAGAHHGRGRFFLHAAGQAGLLLPSSPTVMATHREMGHGGGPCMLHNPSYDFNDELIPLGATYWVRLAQAWLKPMPEGVLYAM